MKKVNHSIIELYPDVLFNKIRQVFGGAQEYLGIEKWDNLELAKLMKTVVDTYSRNIDQMESIRYVVDEQFEFSYKYFRYLFGIFMTTFFFPLAWFMLCKDAHQRNMVFLIWSIFGAFIFSGYEVLQMNIEGPGQYLSSFWNYPDLVGLAAFWTLAVLCYSNQQEEDFKSTC